MIGIIMLTGCGNDMEMENRDYVMAVGIDKDKNYNLTMSVAKLSEGSDKEERAENIVEGIGSTIANAIADANNKTKGSIYLGHNKVIILSDDFKDYDELIEYTNKNIEISRDIVIVKAENPAEAIKAKNNDDTASEYIYTYFENKNKVDLDSLMDYYNNKTSIELPRAVIENDKIIVE